MCYRVQRHAEPREKGTDQPRWSGPRWRVGAGRWALDGGRWTVGAGRWALDGGRWTVGAGRWALDGGRWTVLDGGATDGRLMGD
jgi:hypothetical protein